MFSFRDGVWIFGVVGGSSKGPKYPGGFPMSSWVFCFAVSMFLYFVRTTERINQKNKVRGK